MAETDYATISFVALEGRRQDDLRKAESQRVNDLFAAQAKHSEALFSGLKDTLTAQVDRIDALFSTAARDIIAGQARTETTAANLDIRVKELAQTMASGVEDTRKANQATVDKSNSMFDSRIKPLEEALSVDSGRSTVTDKILFAAVGVGFTLLGGLVSRLVFGT
jgi:hypothetical protein